MINELDEWQKEVLEYEGDIALCTGRRGGKTYIFCYKAIEKMRKRPKTRIGLSSLTEDQAIFIITTMKEIASEICPALIGTGKDKPTLKELTFKNGSVAFSRPVGAAGDSWRGYELDYLYVDEASRMPKLFWLAAKPTIMTTGGKIWMASTPAGKKGYFWDKFDESVNKKLPEARFKFIYKNSEEIIKERKISRTWTEKQREEAIRVMKEDQRDMTKTEYGQEYLGLFLEDTNQFYEDEIIDASQTEEKQQQNLEISYWMGVDIARFGGDEIVYSIFKKQGDDIIQVESITKKNQPTNITEEDIIILNRIWKPKQIGIDAGAGALGVTVYDHLIVHNEVGKRVVAMNNRAISLNRDGTGRQKLFKEDMHNLLKSLMQQGRVKLLKSDAIKASLRSVQYEVKDDGRVEIFGSYTHHVESIMRAVHLAEKAKINKFRIAYI